MLRFRPKTNEMLGAPYESDEKALGYLAYDDEENICGRVVFYLNGYDIEIIQVDAFDNDLETEEGLIRSALNYGANRSAYIACYSAPQAIEVAKMLGFEKKKDKLYGEIPFLLSGKCCK